MPAVLRTEEDVSTWLDWDSVSAEDALKVIHPVEDLAWHPVTRAMGNATYKEPDASSPITFVNIFVLTYCPRGFLRFSPCLLTDFGFNW